MEFIFHRHCDLCKGIFRKKDMIHDISIGPHYPWSNCRRCYLEFFKLKDNGETIAEIRKSIKKRGF